MFDGGGLRAEPGVRLVFGWLVGALVGVLARDADETCCREVLPLVLEYLLKVEGELERDDTGLPWVEVSLILLASLGRREDGDAGDAGEMGESASRLVAP
jgi:hypothetical protein